MRRARPLTLCALILSGAAVLAACASTGSDRLVTYGGVQMKAEEAARLRYEQATEKRAAGDVEGAKDDLRAILDEYPDADFAELATVDLAAILLDEGEADEAQRILERLLVNDPASAVAERARYLLAISQLDQGRAEEAAPELEKSIDRLEDPAAKKQAVGQLAETMEKKDQPSQAAKYHQRALTLSEDPEERQARSEAILRLVDEEMPFTEVRKLAETGTEEGSFLDEMVLFKLARIHLHLRDERSAYERLQQYLERYPEGRFVAEARSLKEQLEKRVEVAPRTVGVVLPLTGKYESYGKRVLTSIRLGLGFKASADDYADDATGVGSYERKLEGGEKLALVVKDSAGDPEIAQTRVKELVEEDHAIAIIGDILLDTSLPVALRAEEYGVPLISLSRREGLADLGPWSFRMSFTTKKQAKALAELAMEKLGHKRFAVLYPKHPYGVELMNAFWDEIDKRQGEITAVESYSHDQTTFTGEVRSMVGRAHLDARYEFNVCKNKAKGIEDGYRRKKALEECQADVNPIVDFDALLIPDDYRTVSYILPAFAAEDVLLTRDKYKIAVFRKTTDSRVKPVQLLGGNMWNDPELGKRLGRNIDGALFVDGFYARSGETRVKKFVKRFARVHRSRPGLLEAQARDTGALVAAVIEGGAGERPKSRLQMQEALARTKDFPGVTGLVTFDEEGDSATPPLFFTFEKGRLELAEEEDLTGEGEG